MATVRIVAVGTRAPETRAITASPMYFSTVPPYCRAPTRSRKTGVQALAKVLGDRGLEGEFWGADEIAKIIRRRSSALLPTVLTWLR